MGAQNTNRAKMRTIVVRQDTLEELTVFNRHTKIQCDQFEHRQTENIPNPKSNPDRLAVNFRTMDNTSLPTDTKSSCTQKGEHKNGFRYI